MKLIKQNLSVKIVDSKLFNIYNLKIFIFSTLVILNLSCSNLKSKKIINSKDLKIASFDKSVKRKIFINPKFNVTNILNKKLLLTSLLFWNLPFVNSWDANNLYAIRNDSITDIDSYTKTISPNYPYTNYTEIFPASDIAEDSNNELHILFKNKFKGRDKYDILYAETYKNSFNTYNISIGKEDNTPVKILKYAPTISFIIGNSRNTDNSYGFMGQTIKSSVTNLRTLLITKITNENQLDYKSVSASVTQNELVLLGKQKTYKDSNKYNPLISFFELNGNQYPKLNITLNITDELSDDLFLNDIFYTNDNGLILIGSDYSIPIYSLPIIMKMDSNKKIVWNKLIYFKSFTKTNPMSILNGLETKNDDCIVTTGLIRDKFQKNKYMTLPWIMSISKNGIVNWLAGINLTSSVIYTKVTELKDNKIVVSSVLENYENVFTIISKDGILEKSFSICPTNKSLNILSINNNENGDLLFSGRLIEEKPPIRPIFGKLSENFTFEYCPASIIASTLFQIEYEFLDTQLNTSIINIITHNNALMMYLGHYQSIKNICTKKPTNNPTFNPTISPTFNPTYSPTLNPTSSPTIQPSLSPTLSPTKKPTKNPTLPTLTPTRRPIFPTPAPTKSSDSSFILILVLSVVSIILFFLCCYILAALIWYRVINKKEGSYFILKNKKQESDEKIKFKKSSIEFKDKNKAFSHNEEEIMIEKSDKTDKNLIFNKLTDEGISDNNNKFLKLQSK
ncbi:MAG: hypothetical protein GY830_01335 [Bacteroidetes bacterium]|nr:hypothetical protein [Bacteroidota bacterium]